ncbi:MAG: hypothetical protein ACREQM_05325 [Candidatus Dormibacteraceae bacterium]
MKYAMGLLFVVGVGLVVGGVLTVVSGSGPDASEWRFSGGIGAIGGLVMIVTVLLLPLTAQKPAKS